MATTRRRPPAVVVTALVTVAVLLSGCTLRQDDQPREITRNSLPDVLFQQSPGNASPGSETRTFFLVKSGGTKESLFRVLVAIQPPANPADFPRTIIEKLVTNPPVSDAGEFSSAVPITTRVLAVKQHDDVLDIDLSSALGTIELTQQRLAVGQIVYTATAIVGINFVRFFIDGTPSAVPVDDHTAEAGALISREDFPKLRPEPNTTTTTAATAATAATSETSETTGVADSTAPEVEGSTTVVTDAVQGNR